DGKFIAIGSIEPPFYAALLSKLGLADDTDFADQMNQAKWPSLTARLAAIFKTRTRDAWCAHFEGSEVCYAPVLSLAEAPQHTHNVARGAFVTVGGVVQPAPLPRFSRTPARVPHAARPAGADAEEALRDWGVTPPDTRLP